MPHKRPSVEEILSLLHSDSEAEDHASDYESSTDDNEEDGILSADSYDSDDSDEPDEPTTQTDLPSSSANPTIYYSKDKKETWDSVPINSPQGRARQANVMREGPGPSRFATRETDTIKSAFLLFFRKPLVETICKWTNKEGLAVFGAQWSHLTTDELYKFIGVLILIGRYKGKDEEPSQFWSRECGPPIFNKLMRLNRFQNITRVLRFDDDDARQQNHSTDKLQPIRECFDEWVKTLSEAFVPGETMTLDEQLVTFRGRCPFKQYTPSKPGEYGIKIWAICDSRTSYAYDMQVHTGKWPDQGRDQGEQVVMDLAQKIFHSGRNITCDKFFTSLQLAKKLLEKNITVVGTIHKNKEELPQEFVTTKNRKVHSTLFGFQKDVMIASYCPKKNKVVTLLSSMHSQPTVQDQEDKKPEIIQSCIETIGGVSTLDKMVGNYSTKVTTKSWPMVIFYNMLDVSALNAYIIWMFLNPDWEASKVHKRRAFLMHLGQALAGVPEGPDGSLLPLPSTSEEPPRKKAHSSIFPYNKDRETQTVCSKCKKSVSQEHLKVLCLSCAQ